MKKKLIAILSALMLLQGSANAQISSWAKTDFEQMSTSALLSSQLLEGNMTDKITRAEFCALIVNTYKLYNNISLKDEDRGVFLDTDDENVLKAYKAGLVSGKGDGLFEPNGYITRQEIAVMMSRLLSAVSPEYITYSGQVVVYKSRYLDCEDTAQWAINDIAAMCSYKIINGTGDGLVEPLSYTTKEQAICVLNRAVNTFIEGIDQYSLPRITASGKNTDGKEYIDIKWSLVPLAVSYDIVIKRQGMKNVNIDVDDGMLSLTNYELVSGVDGKYTVYVVAKLSNGLELITMPVEFYCSDEPEHKEENISKEEIKNEPVEPEYTVPQKPSEEFEEEEPSSGVVIPENATLALTEKEKRVFPLGYYFQNAEEAESYMKGVTVPVWAIDADGTKFSSTKTLTVNQALAEDVVNIFTEIYNDPSQFPIKDVGGYYWRNTAYGKISQHSFGTCIDINYNENYYVTPDGVPVVGTHWKPGEDPYSIPEDSVVVKAFAKYGWLWGGNAWGPSYNKDYMHFTYLGK